MEKKEEKRLLVLLAVFLSVFIWSAIRPFRFHIWLSEAFFPFLTVIFLVLKYRKFRFSTLTYTLIFLQAILFLVGAHHSFEHVRFFPITIHGGIKRNTFDWFSHFFIGFPLTFASFEIFAKKAKYETPAYLYLTAVICTFATTVAWELLEWGACLATGNSFDIFNGVRWDTYWDMLFTVSSAILSLPLIWRWQKKSAGH